MKELIEKLNKAADAYYNSGKPIMSDAEYDKLLEELQEKEKETGVILSNSPTLKVGTSILSELPKIRIMPPMLSLNKCHTVDEIKNFNAVNKKLIAMWKCDGLSVRLIYENGKLLSANTRGNGDEGAIVTDHVKQFINVPITIKKEGRYVIDGEAIIKEKDFDSEQFANPRNAASGALNLLDTREVKRRKLSFIGWDVIEGSQYNLLSDKLNEADKLGFETTDFAYDVDLYDDVNKLLTVSAKSCGIPIDGIVWKFNDTNYGASLGRTSHHYRCGIAWKPEHETVKTTLTGIEWSMGRTGQITPVALFNTVELDGSEVSRASLHNLTIMEEVLGNTPHIGQSLTIYKANLIVPQIEEADKEEWDGEVIQVPSICPFCGQPLTIDKENESAFLMCHNDLCPSRVLNNICHYGSKDGLDIKGLSTATVEFLLNKNWINNILDLYNLDKYSGAWMGQTGWGPASVNKVINSINACSTNVEPWRFISSLGIPLVGKRMSKQLMYNFNSVEDFINAAETGYEFEYLDSIGPEIANSIRDFNYSMAKELLKNKYVTLDEKKEEKPKQATCAGLSFVITGSLNKFQNRNELVAKIEGLGGRVSGSVSGSTSYLIINDLNSTTSKAVKARSLSIPCISEEEFIDKFLK